MDRLSTPVHSSVETSAYRATALRRLAHEQRALALRQARAWDVARRAAELLKGQYAAQRVVLFGSLARESGFHTYSDVDLAVWGLDDKVIYRVTSQLLDLEPGIEVDVVMAEDLSAVFRRIVESEGIPL